MMNISISIWGLKPALLFKNAWFHNSAAITILTHSNKGSFLQLHQSGANSKAGRAEVAFWIHAASPISFSCWFDGIAFKCVFYGCLWTPLEEKIAPVSHLWCSTCVVRAKSGGCGEVRGTAMVAEVSAPSSELGDEFMHRHSLEGPEAMTSHPSPYTLIHFTFISTSNDFPPMKGSESRLRHLLGKEWNLSSCTGNHLCSLKMWQVGYTAITEVTTIIFTFSSKPSALCSWHSKRLTHA